MSNKENGGAAFPNKEYETYGMTLRDYFAANAMQALVENREGKLYEFIEISSWGSARTIDDSGTGNGIMPGQFRWHCRPPQ